MAVDPVAVTLSAVQLIEKLFSWVRELTITYRVARAEIQELLEQLNSWVSKLKNMASIISVSLLTDADNDEWYDKLQAINHSFVKLHGIVGNRGYWINVKFGFGRSKEVQMITCSIEKKVNILEEIHKRTCVRYARAKVPLQSPLILTELACERPFSRNGRE